MMKPVVVLFATQSGTAEMVADEVVRSFKKRERAVTRLRLDKTSPEIFASDALFLIFMSTYGAGDVPDNAFAFFESLRNQRPDLSHVRYALFGLGDSHTHGATFCQGPRDFDACLTSLGARRIVASAEHDLAGKIFPEDMALDWLKDVLAAE